MLPASPSADVRQEARRRSPWQLLVPGAVAVAFLAVPLLGLASELPVRDLGHLLTAPESLTALRLSLVTSTTATALAFLLGVPLAWLLARTTFPGHALVRALVLLPLVLPPVVGGVALLTAFGRRGLVGGPLYDLTGWQLPFSTAGVVVAELFVAMPFLVVTVEGALRALDQRYEEAAATLGAGRMSTLATVVLPLVGPSLVAGGVLCWARALGEFGATITFAGSFPGRTQTLPLAVYAALETDRASAVALSMLLLVVSALLLVLLRRHYVRGVTAP